MFDSLEARKIKNISKFNIYQESETFPVGGIKKDKLL
jgi:hypothetical protein